MTREAKKLLKATIREFIVRDRKQQIKLLQEVKDRLDSGDYQQDYWKEAAAQFIIDAPYLIKSI